jgi:hypothetical protein
MRMLLRRFKLHVEYFQKCSAPHQKPLDGGDYGGSSAGLIFVDLHLHIALLPDHVQSLVKLMPCDVRIRVVNMCQHGA